MMVRALFLPCLLLCAAILRGGEIPCFILKNPATKKAVPYSFLTPGRTIAVPKNYRNVPGEFRGIWISTVANLDFPQHKTSDEFKKTFRTMAKQAADAGFTALIFQVRPCNDAFYKSKINPWSKYLTGIEGAGFGGDFDPMTYMIETAHAFGLEFHAWLNPYRVAGRVSCTAFEYIKTLTKQNFASKKPSFVLSIPSGNGQLLLLNPGEPEVLLHFSATVREILENYDVDGIHLDDYFYPYEGIGEEDNMSFFLYAEAGSTVEQWRRANVNLMIENIGKFIKKHNAKKNKRVRFGVSPFGIWANQPSPKPSNPAALEKWRTWKTSYLGSPTRGGQSYFTQFVDTRKWVKNSWIDYIAPQIYWGFSHSAASYAAVADWWAETVRGTDVDLYTGHGIYRMGVNSDCMDPSELQNQLKYNQRHPEIRGVIFYSWRNVFGNLNKIQKNSLQTVFRQFWHTPPPPK